MRRRGLITPKCCPTRSSILPIPFSLPAHNHLVCSYCGRTCPGRPRLSTSPPTDLTSEWVSGWREGTRPRGVLVLPFQAAFLHAHTHEHMVFPLTVSVAVFSMSNETEPLDSDWDNGFIDPPTIKSAILLLRSCPQNDHQILFESPCLVLFVI